MFNKIITILKLNVFFLFFATEAFSYFDPGTGAFIFQTIVAFISALVFFFLHPIQSIKSFIDKIKKKFKKNKEELDDK